MQTLNLPGADRPGSAGRALPHARLRIAADGEIEVARQPVRAATSATAAPPPRLVAHRRPRPHRRRRLSARQRPQEARADHRLRPQRLARMGRDRAARRARASPRPWCSATAQPALSAVLWPTRGPMPTTPRCRRPWMRPTPRCPTTPACSAGCARRADFSVAHGHGHGQRPAAARRDLQRHADALGIAPLDPHPTHEDLHELSCPTGRNKPPTPATGLLGTPIIQGCLRGEVSLPSYLAFLREAYHHVRHTVPLLRGVQGRAAGAPRTGCAARWTNTSRRSTATTSGSSTTSAPAAAMPRRCATAGPATPPR